MCDDMGDEMGDEMGPLVYAKQSNTLGVFPTSTTTRKGHCESLKFSGIVAIPSRQPGENKLPYFCRGLRGLA
jgi:hypothetical protein